MRWKSRLAAGAVVALGLTGCGNGTTHSAAFEEARTDLRSRSTYHLSGVVKAPAPLASELDGTYEIDFQRPDRYLSVRMAGPQETSRTVAIGDEVFGSTDGGASWQRATLGQAGDFSPTTLIGMLDAVCTVSGDGSRLRVEVKSRKQGCEKPLAMSVKLAGGLINSMEVEMPTELGPLSVTARFDFGRTVPPIVAPVSEASS